MCLHVLGSWIGFFLGESALVERMYAVFLCASCGFYIIFNFYLSGCSSRERGRSVLLLCSVSSRVRTFISVLPRTSAAAPSDPSLFSLTNIFSSISSHLISSHLKTSIINQSSAPCHSTIPQYLYFYSLQGVKTPLLLSCMFFCVIIALSFDPWRAPL
jgi:hypothetical protein